MPVMTLATPTASSSGDDERHVAYTASPRAYSCLHSSNPSPALAPVTTTVIGIVLCVVSLFFFLVVSRKYSALTRKARVLRVHCRLTTCTIHTV